MNTNTMELSMEEMELINGGFDLWGAIKGALIGAGTGAVGGAIGGAIIGGGVGAIPGALAGALVGGAAGAVAGGREMDD